MSKIATILLLSLVFSSCAVAGERVVVLPPFVTRTPNGVYEVVQRVEAEITDGGVSDFVLNVPYARSDMYQDVEYKRTAPKELLKPYRESGDLRWFFTATNCIAAPVVENEFRVTLYKIQTDFSKIGPRHPYDPTSRLYQDCVRPREVEEYLKNDWVRESVERLKREAKGDPLAYARLAYAHMVTNFTYGLSPPKARMELARVIRERKGDCGRLSSVYVQLLRAGGVPSRMNACMRPVAGQEYHCWAEFYLEKYGWFPVDVTFDLGKVPSYRHFGNYSDRTVVMTRGQNFQLESQGGRRFNMEFCQHLSYWFWNRRGRHGKVKMYSTFKGLKVGDSKHSASAK